MQPKEVLDALRVAERLKDTTRHCTTSGGRPESVAEHSWMLTLSVFFLQDALRAEFPGLAVGRVLEMCLIHDLGEAFTGDIPVFDKTAADEQTEEQLLAGWVQSLGEPTGSRMQALYQEMAARDTLEAKVYKALDGMEALIQHNLSPIETWTEAEYALNMTYANDRVGFSRVLTALRQAILEETVTKIRAAGKPVPGQRGEFCARRLFRRRAL